MWGDERLRTLHLSLVGIAPSFKVLFKKNEGRPVNFISQEPLRKWSIRPQVLVLRTRKFIGSSSEVNLFGRTAMHSHAASASACACEHNLLQIFTVTIQRVCIPDRLRLLPMTDATQFERHYRSSLYHCTGRIRVPQLRY
jgi:hypothetical protein